jgi:hypothetical protein
LPVETIEPESPIPTGEATEIIPETVEVGAEKMSPADAKALAMRAGVPDEWMQEHRGMTKQSAEEVKTQYLWEQASDRLMQAHDWTMAGRDAERNIRDEVAAKMGTRRINRDPDKFNREVARRMDEEAQRIETERGTPGTMAYRRAQKSKENKPPETTQLATRQEIDSVIGELDSMHKQGRISDSEMRSLSDRIKSEAEDADDALDIIDETMSKKNAGYLRDHVGKGRGASANEPEAANAPDQVTQQDGVQQERGRGNEGGQAAEAGVGNRVQREAQGAGKEAPEGVKLVPGRIYTDAKGNRAIYQADGTWKEVE